LAALLHLLPRFGGAALAVYFFMVRPAERRAAHEPGLPTPPLVFADKEVSNS
jgi:hypothetical protein